MLHLSQIGTNRNRRREMKIIAIDVDGVVAQLAKVWLEKYNKDYDDDMTLNDWTDWDIDKLIKPECGKRIYHYIEDPHIYDEVIPYPGALNKINTLKGYFRVIFVTTSTQGAAGRKFRWLREWKFLESQEDYVECKDKSLVFSDYLIDDDIKNVSKPVPYGKRINILMTRPWNEKYSYSPRMRDWNNLYDFIK
jgi:5'-nucleotidase